MHGTRTHGQRGDGHGTQHKGGGKQWRSMVLCLSAILPLLSPSPLPLPKLFKCKLATPLGASLHLKVVVVVVAAVVVVVVAVVVVALFSTQENAADKQRARRRKKKEGEKRGEGGATPALKIHKVIIYILSFLYLIVVVVL